MAEIVLPKRRFALLRRILRKSMPGLYGWRLGNATLRRVFGVIKGEQKIIVGDAPAKLFTTIYETHYWVDDESRSVARLIFMPRRRSEVRFPACCRSTGFAR
jgi:hypothetical protein